MDNFLAVDEELAHEASGKLAVGFVLGILDRQQYVQAVNSAMYCSLDVHTGKIRIPATGEAFDKAAFDVTVIKTGAYTEPRTIFEERVMEPVIGFFGSLLKKPEWIELLQSPTALDDM
ncbi:hypothetical protein XP1511_22025 [Xanthomonas perforans]|uniref:Uncharacterized protein n=1 Tax=Xanthomonas perforans TaxID=442694 RepID=A0ABR5EMA2_XANPE|nr:hypothetical protein XP315_21310 [Xanthomonas perforans]KLC11141.1 hypothetical protein XP4B_13405 [Xanthomonas perforans]KLC15469.1 hypothetical protein XP56_16810 [Xanthomonas perforans]KLC36727.1 hypothetical protein XP112_10880 [Xanthomonas perforans]KLC39206.1 hypothetical protein XP95_00930 [Xanthomonas perforans]